MARAVPNVLFAFFVNILIVNQAVAGFSISKIAERCGPAVVIIIARDREGHPISQGSGFFINAEGDLVTSRHVLCGCSRASVMTSSGKEGEILYISEANPLLDIVVAKTSLRDTPFLLRAESQVLSVGEQVVCLGNPKGLPGAISIGEVSHLRRMGCMQVLQMTAPVLPGCSGGPVMDTCGRVVGISTAFLDIASHLNFALSVKALEALSPTRLTLSALERPETRLEAVISERAVVELRISPQKPKKPKGAGAPEGHGAFSGDSMPAGNVSPGIVFFKNGKTLLCDRAWRQGTTVYLLAHGKGFALGYSQDLIDLNRSFNLRRW